MGDYFLAYQLHSDVMLSKQGKYSKIRSRVNRQEGTDVEEWAAAELLVTRGRPFRNLVTARQRSTSFLIMPNTKQ